MTNSISVGIIGTGVSGLACAQYLQNAGVRVQLFEKSRGVGGRMATRRGEEGVTFDHGAQYFTVRDSAFRECVDHCCAEGVVAKWDGKVVTLEHGRVSEFSEERERFVGVPAMNAVAKSLAKGLDVATNATIQKLGHASGKWLATDNAGNMHGPFDALISTAPPPQTFALFRDVAPDLAKRAAEAVMAPCWAVMMRFENRLALPYDAAFVHDSPLSWIACNSSKPSRSSDESWVLHASPAWSREHLEDEAESVSETMLAQFLSDTQLGPIAPTSIVAHRWRYALPETPLPERFLYDEVLQLGACGDWCGGPRVEGAFLGGRAMAERVIQATLPR